MLRIPGFIPIRVHPFFWLLAIAIGWMSSYTVFGTLIWVGIILVSVIIHEYGHALTAIAFGQDVRIDLVGFGGLTHRHGGKLKLWQEFLVTFNGPLAGLIFAFICFLILQLTGGIKTDTLFRQILDLTMVANIFWTALNLLPIQPLDGGNLIRIVFEGMFGLKGIKISLFLSIILSAIIGIAGFIFGQLLFGVLFFILTFENFRIWQNSLSMTEKDKDETLQNMLKDAENEAHLGNQDEAMAKLEKLRETSQKGVIFITATEIMAEILHSQGRYHDAFDLLAPYASKLSPNSLRLLHQLAFQSGDLKTATNLGNQTYQIFPGYETALINALSYSLLGDVKPAVGWLQCAIRDGLPNIKAILSKTEFDKIRNTPQFKDLQRQEYGKEI